MASVLITCPLESIAAYTVNVVRVTMVYHIHTAFSLLTIDLNTYNTYLGAGTAYETSLSAKTLLRLSVNKYQFLGTFQIVPKST